MSGFISIHRQILDSEIFASEKGLKIWIWLLLKARHSDGFVPVTVGNGQQIITLKKGQLLFGRYKAEEELNINGSTIYKWMKHLEEKEMIKLESNSHFTVVSIVKWVLYQENSNSKKTAKEQHGNNRVTAAQQHGNTNNNVNTVNNVNNENNDLTPAQPGLFKEKTFKQWDEKEFMNDVARFTEKYEKPLLREFFDFWKEKSPAGKMRFQLQKTWETKLRLQTWKRNKLKKDANTSGSIGKINRPEITNIPAGNRGQL